MGVVDGGWYFGVVLLSFVPQMRLAFAIFLTSSNPARWKPRTSWQESRLQSINIRIATSFFHFRPLLSLQSFSIYTIPSHERKGKIMRVACMLA